MSHRESKLLMPVKLPFFTVEKLLEARSLSRKLDKRDTEHLHLCMTHRPANPPTPVKFTLSIDVMLLEPRLLLVAVRVAKVCKADVRHE